MGGYFPGFASNYLIGNLLFLFMKLRVLVISLLLLAPLTPSISATPLKAGAICSKAGITKNYNGKKYTCIKSGKKLVWNKGVVIKGVAPIPIPTPSPTPTPTPATSRRPVINEERSGDTCSELGLARVVNGLNLECRYGRNKKLIYVDVTNGNDAPTVVIGNSPIDTCKIKDQRSLNIRLGGQATGFPLEYSRMRPNGVIKVAVLPLDFPGSPKPNSPSSYLKAAIEQLTERNKYLYGNRIKYEWTILSDWLMMPKSAEYFAFDHQTVKGDGSRVSDNPGIQVLSDDEQASLVFTEAEKLLNIRDFDFFWTLTNPLESKVPTGPYGAIRNVKTSKDYYQKLNYYPIGFRVLNGEKHLGPIGTLQDLLAHEMAHYNGLSQHAPGNGWGWYISNNPTWEAWLAGWRPDSEFVCFDKSSEWLSAQVSLSSMDLNSKGYKSLVIKISSTQAVIVESRRKGPFTTALPNGIAGITAYVFDATKSGERWDGDLSRELDYFLFFLRITSKSHTLFEWQNLAMWDENIIAYEGDSFEFGGIRISLDSSAAFDTVLLTRTS